MSGKERRSVLTDRSSSTGVLPDPSAVVPSVDADRQGIGAVEFVGVRRGVGRLAAFRTEYAAVPAKTLGGACYRATAIMDALAELPRETGCRAQVLTAAHGHVAGARRKSLAAGERQQGDRSDHRDGFDEAVCRRHRTHRVVTTQATMRAKTCPTLKDAPFGFVRGRRGADLERGFGSGLGASRTYGIIKKFFNKQ